VQHKTQTLLAREEAWRCSGACARDGRPLAHQVFFEPDNWLVPDDYSPLLAAHAAYLMAQPGLAAVMALAVTAFFGSWGIAGPSRYARH